jgi:hypothetical protein
MAQRTESRIMIDASPAQHPQCVVQSDASLSIVNGRTDSGRRRGI